MSSNHVTMPGNLQADDGPDGRGHFQNDQLPPEVQCIMGIFSDCISKAETAAILPPVLLLNSQSRLEDPELSRLLDEHQVLEQKLETFEWHVPEEGEGEDEEGHQAMIQLEEEIKNSFRDLLRLLRALPKTVSAWKAEEGEELGLSERALIRELSVFQNHMVEKWLSRKHEEPQLAPAKEASSSDQDEEYMALMQFLAAEIKEVDSKISDKNHEIENLQRSLEDKKVKANLLAKQHQSILETSDLTIQKIQQNVNEVSVQLKKLIRENRQAEKTLHEKNSKMERDTEALLQDFDDEIEEIQANLEQNEYKYELELEELHKEESRIAALEPEYDGVMKKRQLAEERKKELARLLKLKTRAALIAQAWWRGYCVRKAMAGKSKGKKDKKQKGKKK